MDDAAAKVRRSHWLGRGDRRAGGYEEDQQTAAEDLRNGQAKDGRRREAAWEVYVANRWEMFTIPKSEHRSITV